MNLSNRNQKMVDAARAILEDKNNIITENKNDSFLDKWCTYNKRDDQYNPNKNIVLTLDKNKTTIVYYIEASTGEDFLCNIGGGYTVRVNDLNKKLNVYILKK